MTVHSLQEDLLAAHRTWRRSCRCHRATGHDGLNCRDFPDKMLRCKQYTRSYLRPFPILLAEIRSGCPFRMSTSGPTHVERTQGSTRDDVRDAFNAPDHSDWSEESGVPIRMVWVWTIATWRLLLSTYAYMYLLIHVHTHMQIRTHMTHHPMQVISEVTVTDIQQLSPTTKGFTLQAHNKELWFKPGQW